MKLNRAKVAGIIFKWVEKNYDRAEAQDPSWDIQALADEIVKEYKEGE